MQAVRNIFWWLCFVALGICVQSLVPCLDALVVGLVILLQERDYKNLCWLLPLLLALLLLWLLLAALGILPSPLPASCLKPAVDPRLDQATQAAEKQRNELEELLRQLREKALLCKPPQPKPEPKPEPPKPQPEVDTPQLVPD